MDLTARMHKVYGRAATEAKYAGVNRIGVEHFFLAILDEEESVPTQVMTRMGVRDKLHRELRRVMESPEYRGTSE